MATRLGKLGEYFREVSVLVFVFGALDPWFHQPSWPDGSHVPLGFWYAGIVAVASLTFLLGIRLEFGK